MTRVSLFMACTIASLTCAQLTIADDEAPATAPPPSLAPEGAAPPVPEAPVTKSDVEDAFKQAAETPEPSATATPEATEASETPPPPAVAAAPEPASSESAEEARQENVVEAKQEHGVPPYKLHKPNWAFELVLTPNALGGGMIAADQSGDALRAVEIQFEYQPTFLQVFGVLGFGLSTALYPATAAGDTAIDTTVVGSVASIWSIGAQIRYQARFFREQVFVPEIAYEYKQLSYSFADGTTGGTAVTGPMLGAMILLNTFEPNVASEMYVSQGISRSYFVAEYKLLSGSDGTINVGGSSLYMGLRLEF